MNWQCMLPTHCARKPTIVYPHKKKMGTMRKHTTLLCTVHPPLTKTATLDKHACKHKRTQPFSQTNWKMSLQSLLWNSVHIVQPEHLLLCKGWGAPPSNFFSPFCCKAHASSYAYTYVQGFVTFHSNSPSFFTAEEWCPCALQQTI